MNSTNKQFTVGFIGLGHMGFPMACNLVKNIDSIDPVVKELYVYDLVKQPVEQLHNLGAVRAESILEIAQNCDLIFTSLQTGEQVKAVCLGDSKSDGIFGVAQSGSYFVDCSSIDVETCRELHGAARTHNINMLDAPVSGGAIGAKNALLTIMAGGQQDVFNTLSSVLQLMGKNIIHAGIPGTGQVAKICNNMILGVTMTVVSEAFVLAEKLGLEPQKFFDISSKASGSCWAMNNNCPYPGILNGVPSDNDYKPGFAASMMLKDLNLSQSAAKFAGISTEMGAKATQMYQDFVNLNNNGHLDFSAIIKYMNHGNNLK